MLVCIVINLCRKHNVVDNDIGGVEWSLLLLLLLLLLGGPTSYSLQPGAKSQGSGASCHSVPLRCPQYDIAPVRPLHCMIMNHSHREEPPLFSISVVGS